MQKKNVYLAGFWCIFYINQIMFTVTIVQVFYVLIYYLFYQFCKKTFRVIDCNCGYMYFSFQFYFYF